MNKLLIIGLFFVFICMLSIKDSNSRDLSDYLVIAQAIPRSLINSGDSFNINESIDYEEYKKQYDKIRKGRQKSLDSTNGSVADKVHSLSPYANEGETEKRMNEKFNKYIEKQKEKDIHILLGVNEIVKGDDIDDMMAFGFRFNYQNILEQYLNISGKNFYPWVTVGSKGMSISPFSYAIVNTNAFKFYLDPLIPFINWKQGKMSWGSGASAGYYHSKYSSWGLEAMYKFLWSNPYDDTEYEYYKSDYMGTVNERKIKEGKKRRHLFGIFLVYRF